MFPVYIRREVNSLINLSDIFAQWNYMSISEEIMNNKELGGKGGGGGG